MPHLVEDYSGVVLNQNQKPNTANDHIDITDGAWRYQEFFLPANYVRGTDTSELITPPLSGTQLLVGIEDQHPSKLFGVAGMLNDYYLTDARIMGAEVIRVETWGGAVPNGVSGVSDTIEAAHALVNTHGQKTLPLVNDYGRAWDDPLWEQEALAAVPYADTGFIEIANEPYGSWFWGAQSQDPQGYAAMVKRCADAVGPYGVQVLFAAGGAGSVGLDYFDGVSWSQDATGHGWIGDAVTAVPDLLERIGGIAIHPYDILPGEGGVALIGGVENRLDVLGYSRTPIWFTECGRKVATDDNPTPSSPEVQAQAAQIYIRDYLYSADHNVACVIWYNQKDWTPFDPNGDNGWGTIDENDVRRPVWYMLQALASEKPTLDSRIGPPSLEWKVEYDIFGIGWIEIASGTATGAPVAGSRVWMDLLFDKPVEVGADMLDARYRLGFRVADEKSNVKRVWFSSPNPLATRFAMARAADGTTPIQSDGQDVSFLFRVLGLIADEGTDFLGNSYRSAVRASAAGNVSTVDGALDAIWLSKPNPSRFAIESLYFDLRTYRPTTYTAGTPNPQKMDDSEVVIDSVLVDPVTPNVYFNVYYSSDGDAATTEEEWEWKMWDRVPMTFKATKRESHALPQPIRAKYIKIEFTHLQADHYAPGPFAKPVKYKKHPKWVLDYFLARLDSAKATESGPISGRVAVIYDAIDLAYNYYLDDLDQSPDGPYEKNSAYQSAVGFIDQRNDLSDQIDPTMLQKINLAMAPYRSRPTTFADQSTLLGQQANNQQSQQQVDIPDFGDYPIERVSSSASQNDLRDLRDATVVFENDYPVMFFYLTCRHRYREIVASFDQDRAYFVGVREISFQRNRYATAFDTDLYIEPAGDLLNTERNDFAMRDGTMVIS